ncbi:MAG: redoxin family protein [Chloroflexia bacterium]|nr:redoxin family protein [Chloroflexia bacterium]
MVRRFVLAAALTAAGIVPLVGFHSADAQDAAATCASALWLEPLTAAAGTAEATPAEAGESAPAWTTAELTDACSGQTFTLADFASKTVYVEAMATWCPPCRDQLSRVKEAAAQIPEEEREDIVLVVLSSEIDLPREDLATYAVDNDFPFIFAVMPAEMLQAMAEDLGQEIAVPPATPHLIVAPDGTIGELRTGSAAPEEILALLAETREAPAS